jgi:hypothetical protein
MTVFEFLSPIIFWAKLKKIVISVKNWNFYVKTMRVLNENGTLKQMGMRLDLRSRAYYILNLEPETLMMGTEVLDLERSRVLESINLREPTFQNAGLIELIEVKTDRIKTDDYYAYLIQVKYRPAANRWEWFHVVSWLSIAFAICAYSIKYQFMIRAVFSQITTYF